MDRSDLTRFGPSALIQRDFDMDILDEIEGAITDEVGQDDDYNQEAGYQNGIQPQPPHHHQPFMPRNSNYVEPRLDHQYQQNPLQYDHAHGVHGASSSSFSQVDSPSPAHGGRRDGLYHPIIEPLASTYPQPPIQHSTMPLINHARPTSNRYPSQYVTSLPGNTQNNQMIRNEAYADDSGAGLYEYDEDIVDRVLTPAAIVEETGDRSAMRQMQSHGIPLKPTTVLPDSFRRIFSFSSFNAVQSKVFDSAYKTDENLVVSAPTGSGKTIIFELAMLRVAMNKQFQGGSGRSLSVYVAPLKALCSEKAEEWKTKLEKIGLVVAEVTGDTSTDKGFLQQIKNADVIITTPEKWDSVTRRNSQKQRIMERLALIMLDEVHILNEERGATLETVVARMRTTGKDMPVRVVALSATIPNVEDVARWLRPTMASSGAVFEAGGLNPGVENRGTNAVLQMPMAKVFKFGEDFRPTKLTRIVKGFSLNGDNIFPLINRIISELFQLICEHSKGKPILVFAATRNLCLKAAAALVKAYETARESGRRLPWSNHSRSKLSCDNKQVEEFSACGIAFHHGGLSLDDRRKIETAFKTGKIMVIVATSTLAVGVNLPAHTVILAGTYQWSGSGMIDLSDLDVQQMIGRAGRPQYDTEGTAIILCSENNVGKYRDLVNSRTTIESCLHEHLTEHINTEIGLRTITCLQEGQDWIRNSFLYVRIQQNPRHYSGILATAGSTAFHWEEALTRLVARAVEDLQGREMIQLHQAEGTPEPMEIRKISATVYGEAMSANCLSFKTMCNILDVPSKASLDMLLHTLSNAHEYADLKLRNGEKVFYKSLAKDADMRFPLPNGVSPNSAAHKVFIILQMTLGNEDWEPYKEQLKQGSTGPALDSYQVFRVAPRICKAMATVALQREDGETLKNTLALVRIVSGKAWPGTAVIFRQIDAIGAKSINVLASKGITSFQKLAKTDPRQIEMLLNRQTGFGNKIVAAAKTFPVFHINIVQQTQVPADAVSPVEILFRIEIKVDVELLEKNKKKQTHLRTLSMLALLTDGTYVAYRKANAKTLREEDLTMTLPARFQYSNQKFQVIVGLDQVSGCTTQAECRPEIPDGILSSPVTNGLAKIEDEEEKPIPPPRFPNYDITSTALQEDADDDVTMEDIKEEETLRLPNGNWPCSHTCANKITCKHICCKEGTRTKKKPKSSSIKPQVTSRAVKSGIQGPKDSVEQRAAGPSYQTVAGKKPQVSRKVKSTKSQVIDLGSDSDTEDEKTIMKRILAGQDDDDDDLDLPPKKQKRACGKDDSYEFDDPSFDKAVQNLDLAPQPHPAADLFGEQRGVKRNRIIDSTEGQSKSARNPLMNPINSEASTNGEKAGRPRPVKRRRPLANSRSLNDESDSTPFGTHNPHDSQCRPVQQQPDIGTPKTKEPQCQRPLFAGSDDESVDGGHSANDQRQDFVSNGLFGSARDGRGVCVMAKAETFPGSPMHVANDINDDLDAYLDLDGFLEKPHDVESKKLGPEIPSMAPVPTAPTAPTASITYTLFSPVPKLAPAPDAKASVRLPFDRNVGRAKQEEKSIKDHPNPALPTSTNKQVAPTWQFNDISQIKDKSTTADGAHAKVEKRSSMGDDEERPDAAKAEDDFLADFGKWLEDGCLQVKD